MKIDVLFGVSGPIMTLALFMLPQSGVLEILPKGENMQFTIIWRLASIWSIILIIS